MLRPRTVAGPLLRFFVRRLFIRGFERSSQSVRALLMACGPEVRGFVFGAGGCWRGPCG
jgi:hypothetical protein